MPLLGGGSSKKISESEPSSPFSTKERGGATGCFWCADRAGPPGRDRGDVDRVGCWGGGDAHRVGMELVELLAAADMAVSKLLT